MSYISASLRDQVIKRANSCCEYCLIHVDDHFFAHEVDHVVAEKHRGKTTLDNLCFSCFDCNRSKGSDIASLDPDTGAIVGLYHPRTMIWKEHFRLDGALIVGISAVGRVTEYLLNVNAEERLFRRSELIRLGRYPCASKRLS